MKFTVDALDFEFEAKGYELDILGSNLKFCSKDDILGVTKDGPTIVDVESEDRMDLHFESSKSIWLYGICPDGNKVKHDKELIKRILLYESPNTALAIKNSEMALGGDLIRCALDITNCLDLLNLHDMKKLKEYYDWLVSNKKIKKDITDVELISLFVKQYNKIKAIRVLHDTKQKIHKSSSLGIGTYIQYKVIDISCISKIEVVEIIDK